MIPASVLHAYDLGAIRSCKRLSSGLIHATYQIRSSKGIFILQKLHPLLASDAVASDFCAVSSHLLHAGQNAPACVFPKHQRKLLLKKAGGIWRMQTALAGTAYEVLSSPKMAKEAGSMLGRFHRSMDQMEYIFKSPLNLHDTRRYAQVFLSTARKNQRSPLMIEVAEEVAFVARELPKQFLPDSLPKRVVHQDPKISNMLFNRQGRAVAMIDLDTCNRLSILPELGDAFRSWCGKAEDDRKNTFRLPMFRSAWNGYWAEGKYFLTSREQKLVPKAILSITLELASRFLTDYFVDSYFGWNAQKYESRRAANLARARGQIALSIDVKKKFPAMVRIISTEAKIPKMPIRSSLTPRRTALR